MELIEKAERYLGILSDVESELYRHVSKNFEDEHALKKCLETVQLLKTNIQTALDGWRDLHKSDPTRTLYKGEWRTAGNELGAWENMYSTDVYKPVKALAIELPEPGSWRETEIELEIIQPRTPDNVVVLEKQSNRDIKIPDTKVKRAQRDIYTSEGDHLCIDRRWECTTFLRMINRDSIIPQRILAFQVPGQEGKTRLMNRFEHFCRVAAQKSKPVLYAKVDFRDRPLSAYTLANGLVRTMLKNARAAGYELPYSLAERLKALQDEIKKSGSTKSREQLKAAEEYELEELADTLLNCFCDIVDKWTIVLLLDTFEDAGAAGNWFVEYLITTLLGELKRKELDGLIVALAGRTGLSRLASKEEVLFRENLEPMENWEDCQRMADQHYDLTITEGLAKELIETYNGDLLQIDLALKIFKDFPHRMPDADLKRGVLHDFS